MKMITSKGLIALSALACGIAAAGCSLENSDPGSGASASEGSSDNTGSLGLNLTLSNGNKLDAIDIVLSSSALGAPVTRTINVSGKSSTASALFGGLPQGAYHVALAGSAADSECSGAADFTVVAKGTVAVVVPITCNTDIKRGTATINGEFNTCPDLTFMYAAPLKTDVGLPIALEATAVDPDSGDTVSFKWSATDGTFANANAANTNYNCSAPGAQKITLTINDGGSCAMASSVDVFCEATAVCGDGVVETDKGEECEPKSTSICSDTCQDIVIECGNGIVQPGEDCEPNATNTATCTAACKNIVCGDGVVQGAEECELPGTPPGAGNCDAACKIIPSVCGNNILEPGEECDVANDVNCIAATCKFNGDVCGSCQEANCGIVKGIKDTACANGSCDPYIACQEASNCAANDVRDCYCGATAYTTCFLFNPSAPQGPCKDIINGLAGSTTPLEVGTVFFDETAGILGAVNNLNVCTASSCKTQCQ